MITEVVTFKLRPGMTREDVVAVYRKTAPIWRANPECIRKCYLYDAERGLGGGAYLWKSIEAARLAHGDTVSARTGVGRVKEEGELAKLVCG